MKIEILELDSIEEYVVCACGNSTSKLMRITVNGFIIYQDAICEDCVASLGERLNKLTTKKGTDDG